MFDRIAAIIFAASCVLMATARAEDIEPKSYPVLSGVGLALDHKDGQIVVSGVVAKSPADESAQISVGDRITSVNVNGREESLAGKTVGDAVSLIRGPVGSKVILTLAPEGSTSAMKVELTRAPLEIAGAPSSTYAPFIGKPAPPLDLKTLDGVSVEKLSEYRGKVVVLEFWASWCPACYQPVVNMQAMGGDHPTWIGKVELITVTVDADLEKAAAVIEDKMWNKTVQRAVAIDALSEAGVSVVPLVMIIGKDGTVVTMAGAHAVDVETEVSELLDK